MKAGAADVAIARPLNAMLGAARQPCVKEPFAVQFAAIGLDLAKDVVQAHGVDGASEIVVSKAVGNSRQSRPHGILHARLKCETQPHKRRECGLIRLIFAVEQYPSCTKLNNAAGAKP